MEDQAKYTAQSWQTGTPFIANETKHLFTVRIGNGKTRELWWLQGYELDCHGDTLHETGWHTCREAEGYHLFFEPYTGTVKEFLQADPALLLPELVNEVMMLRDQVADYEDAAKASKSTIKALRLSATPAAQVQDTTSEFVPLATRTNLTTLLEWLQKDRCPDCKDSGGVRVGEHEYATCNCVKGE